MKRLFNNTALPKRSTASAAGYELSSTQDCVILAKSKGLDKTRLLISFPSRMDAGIAPRSGISLKKFIDVGVGVGDQDYRGDLGVVLFIHVDEDFQVKQGGKIAHLILEKITTPNVREFQELGSAERGW